MDTLARPTVAVTGPTGTFGSGLLPLLETDGRAGRVVGVSRHPDSGAGVGGRTEHRRGDVRDPQALTAAFHGADVVVHLAFLVTGAADTATIRAVNVGGTLTAFRAAVAAGARRFVYASSLAAYGFSAANPIGMDEDQPLAPEDRFFYAREKAEIEQRLAREAAAHPEVELSVLRPCAVVGPEVLGAKVPLPGPLAPLGRRAVTALRHRGLPLPLVVPELRLQLVHHDDVGQALLRSALGDGPPGAYNVAGDGIVTLAELARELGALVVPLPESVAQVPARAVASLPLPPLLQWVQTATHPAIMDTTRARERLGWRPRWTALDAWRDTLRP